MKNPVTTILEKLHIIRKVEAQGPALDVEHRRMVQRAETLKDLQEQARIIQRKYK